MTSTGGANDMGTIFKIKPDGTGYAGIMDFNGTNGSTPLGSLLLDGSTLFGMTKSGGIGYGVIFKINTDGSGYTKLLDFSGANGAQPEGSLFSDGTFLYGMTLAGGTSTHCGFYGCGTIFKIKFDGTGYSKIHDFDIVYPDGGNPSGTLVFDSTFFYGTTFYGGSVGNGVVFKIKADGINYTDLLDFSGVNGNYPRGSLLIDGGYLYGMTEEGGTNGVGSIYKIKVDGTEYLKLFDFIEADGNSPMGALISDGTALYGMTSTGGSNGDGVIFKYLLPLATGTEVNNELPGLNISPNPSSGIYSVNLNQKMNLKICIYDLLGHCLFNKDYSNITQTQIDLSNQQSGIYFIAVITEDGIVNRRVVKQ